MSLSRPNTFARSLFDALPPRYDRLGAILSFGQDRRWRAAVVAHVVSGDASNVLDVATGPAGVAREIARRSSAHVAGVDLTEPMLRQGLVAIRSDGMNDRIHLVVGRAEQLPFADASFDGMSFTYLLRYVDDPAATLRELARVVQPGAPVASLEFAVPGRRVWRIAWWAYTRWVLPLAGFLTGGTPWFRVGRFLGPNITHHYEKYSLSWTVDAWERAGFVDVRTRAMSLGGGVVITGRRAP